MYLLKLIVYATLLGFALTFLLFHDAHAEMTIHVNKETHTLTVFKDGKGLKAYDVITGRPQSPTPDFVTQFNTIDINPIWHPTPKEIHQLHIHPDLVKHYGVTMGAKPYAAPGPRNPMGVARLNLQYAVPVRIHGTSEPELFKTKRRNYSSGCVRVLKIADLASFIVENLSGEEIDWSRHYTIKLPESVRVVVD